MAAKIDVTSESEWMDLIGKVVATRSGEGRHSEGPSKVRVILRHTRHFNVEQRAILLAAEDIGVAGAAARHPAVYRKLDRQCRIELDVIGDYVRIDAEDPTNRRTRQDPALAHPVRIG
jgi:hypothetical protein